ncbi:MAG: hypothetical protein ACYTAN_08130 [Planctomycetota bacterium]
MKYCLFCRESFEDEMLTCPYCGDDLLDELPDEDYGEEAFAPHNGRPAPEREESEGPPVIQAAIIAGREDLEAAVAVLKEVDIYFEIGAGGLSQPGRQDTAGFPEDSGHRNRGNRRVARRIHR